MASSLAGGNLMNLPSDILLEILARLPAIDVINCKLVCKQWPKILSTREFAKLHLSRPNHINCLAAIQFNWPKIIFRIFKFGDNDDPQNFYHDPVTEFDLSVFPITPRYLVGSVNGLVCCSSGPGEETLYVFNPFTREYVTLPIDVTGYVDYTVGAVYGFGVSTINGQYKVVRLQFLEPYDYDDDDDDNRTGGALEVGIKYFECRVYTLGTGSWRTIDVADPIDTFAYYCSIDGLLFNGNLHWPISNREGSECIFCFNLDNESFRAFPSPFSGELPTLLKFSLGIVTGCLCLCDFALYDDIVIWVMKEYGVKKSWTKDFVIKGSIGPSDNPLSHGPISILKIFKDGDILLSKEKYLVTYNNNSKTLQRTIHVCYDYIQAVLHDVSSFLSLKDFELEKVRTF